MEHTITLPWISRTASPNGGGHYRTIHGTRMRRKTDAWLCCRELPRPKGVDHIPLTIIFNPPTNQRFDLDNALASLKGDLDGIAARLKIDDRMFRPIVLDVGQVGKPGSVDVTLSY